MKKLVLISLTCASLLVVLSLSPIIANQAFAQNQMGVPIMSPRQQMSVLNDPSQIQCREDFVPMMRGSTVVPVCVNPNTYLRLADRGWGNFDMNMMTNNPQQTQNILNSMMSNPNVGKLWYDVVANNQQNVQSMVDQMYSSMKQNPQRMQPVLNFMMNDSELRQKMMDQMLQNSQMMQGMKANSQMMNIIQSGNMTGMNQGITGMMSDPDLRQQMMDKMVNNRQMMQDIKNNNQMMNMMKGQGMMGSMGQGMQGGSMMGSMGQGMMGSMGQGMQGGSMMGSMGQGMMGSSQGMMTTMNMANIGNMMNDPQVRQDMMKSLMNDPQMIQGMMNNKQMMSKLGMMKSSINHNWVMKNPQMMQDRIAQMKNSPQTMSQMNEMMLNNPWNLQGMMDKIQGPMVSSMMSDPELRQQMIDTMMQNQQFMNNLVQNQEFMQQLNP